jgi:hypothetical protein
MNRMMGDGEKDYSMTVPTRALAGVEFTGGII